MIARVRARGIDATETLAEALDRPVSDQEGLAEYTVAAHWPGLDYYTPDDEQRTWLSTDWADHLDDPSWQHPYVASPQDDRRAIWHADVCLDLSDRTLTGLEWSEIAHRLARTAGIHTPGDENGCRWIAVQAQTGRLDLIANLIRPDETWTQQPHRLGQLLSDECRRIESDLGLITPRTGPDPAQAARFAARHIAGQDEPSAESVEAAAQLGQLLKRLADEHTGPLATVRGLVEHAAHRLDRLPHAYGPAAGHQLELIARRLHGLQLDLDVTAAALPTATRTPPPVARPPAVAAAGRGRLPR
ncbi:hypothetical protein [Streptomyces sp. x-80]|uniref:hypothetical protein n=1 Tax=Streptomyces sp. x-80 TaxID=2789282 RepID=UPI0039804372